MNSHIVQNPTWHASTYKQTQFSAWHSRAITELGLVLLTENSRDGNDTTNRYCNQQWRM